MAKVPLTHLSKVFWPREKYTKGDLIAYYESVAPILLPYLKDRPNSLSRFPDGITGMHFFQKNVKRENLPSFVHTLMLRAKTAKKNVRYVLCDNKETLLYLANFGCIELHPWNSRKGSLEKPDYIIFDLDPGPQTKFGDAIAVAQAVHQALEKRRVKSFCKTSGKRGLHVYVPVKGRLTYEKARVFARDVAAEIVAKLPRVASVEHWPKDRRDKIFIDIARNAIGQTTVAPYSVRPWPGAPVSTPLEWREVKKGLSPGAFTIQTIGKRLKQKGDLWKAMRV